MKKLIFLLAISFFSFYGSAQRVGIGTTTPNTSAMLDVTSTNKGFLLPRMTTAGRAAISNPAKGLMVFDSTSNSVWMFDKKWKELSTTATSDSSFVFQNNALLSYLMSPSTTYSQDSSGYIYDSGGPGGNYSNNEDLVFTIAPPLNTVLCKLQVISLNTESPYDSLLITHQGMDPITLSGNVSNQVYYFSNMDAIYFSFISNNINTSSGYQIRFDHYFLPASSPSNLSSTLTGIHYIPEKVALRGGLQFQNNWHRDSAGMFSFSYGQGSKAKGDNSLSMGSLSNATGDFSIAMGSSTTASGFSSLAMGRYTIASGTSSTAMGTGTTASNNYSTAMGNGTTASGNSSTAMGSNTIASDQSATAMGASTEASGNSSTAMGWNTTASGSISTAMGRGSTASGYASTAIGYFTTASGYASIAMGSQSIASGQYSTAIGDLNIAKGYSSTVVGMNNDSILTTNQNSVTATTPLFIVGNGSDVNTRSNALVVHKDGKVRIDPSIKNNGDLTAHALVFGQHNSGEGIASKRTATGNQWGLDFYTGNQPRMNISNSGNVGIGSISPVNKLHVSGSGAGNGTHVGGILVENTNSTTGEAAISFKNSGTNGSGDKLWITGMNEGRNLSWAYGTSFTGANTHMMLDSVGTLEVDNLKTLKVGGGTAVTKKQLGEENAGTNPGGSGFKTHTLIFPTAFSTTPKIIATAKNDPAFANVNDTFVVSIRSISTTQVVFNIQRVDVNTGWNQQIRIEWMAWE